MKVFNAFFVEIKRNYLFSPTNRIKEQELMLKKLREDANKIPSPDREEMMSMFRAMATSLPGGVSKGGPSGSLTVEDGPTGKLNTTG